MAAVWQETAGGAAFTPGESRYPASCLASCSGFLIDAGHGRLPVCTATYGRGRQGCRLFFCAVFLLRRTEALVRRLQGGSQP